MSEDFIKADCRWSMEEWSRNLEALIERMNRRASGKEE